MDDDYLPVRESLEFSYRGVPVDPRFTPEGLEVPRYVAKSMVRAMARCRGLDARQIFCGRWHIYDQNGALVSGTTSLSLGEAAGLLQWRWPKL